MAEANLHPRCQWAGCQHRDADVELVDEKWWLCPAHTTEHRQEHPSDYFVAKERRSRVSARTSVEDVLQLAERGSFLARAAGERARRAIRQAQREVHADRIRDLAREQVPLVEAELRRSMEALGQLRSMAGYGGQRAKRVPGVRPDRGRGRDVYSAPTDAR